jgi:hypothetical protein
MENDDLMIRRLGRASAWVKILFALTGGVGVGLTFAGIMLLYR